MNLSIIEIELIYYLIFISENKKTKFFDISYEKHVNINKSFF